MPQVGDNLRVQFRWNHGALGYFYNNLTYNITSGTNPVPIDDLLNEIRAEILPKWLAFIDDNFTCNRITIRNLNEGSQGIVDNLDEDGDVSGTALIDSWVMVLQTTPPIGRRPGSLRISGIPAAIVNGALIASTWQDEVEAFTDALSSDLEGEDGSYAPITLRQWNGKYDPAVFLTQPARSWFFRGWRTQRSRAYATNLGLG